MKYPLQTIGLNASADVESNRLLVTGDSNTVAQAAGSTKFILGVSGDVAAETGDACDVHTVGIVPVEYGGTVTKDAPLTSDTQGRAVVATTNGAHIVGYALEAGGEGDVGSVDIQKGQLVVAA